MAEKPIEQPLEFPILGLDLSDPFGNSAKATTQYGQNVRTYEALSQRGRGGSRGGLSKFLDDQIGDFNVVSSEPPYLSLEIPIQHMNVIVDPTSDALGWSDGGVDGGDTGDNDGGTGEGPYGGGGYQIPPARLAKFTLRIRVDRTTVPADGTTQATITATLSNSTGGHPFNNLITLHTNPAGRDGDGATSLTAFGTGEAIFTVTDDQPERVTYTVTNSTNITTSIGSVTVKYVGPILVMFFGTDGQPSGSVIENETQTQPSGQPITGPFILKNLILNGIDQVKITVLESSEIGPFPGHTMELHTDPAGQNGDGDTIVSGSDGVAVFTVMPSQRTVYTVTDLTATPDLDGFNHVTAKSGDDGYAIFVSPSSRSKTGTMDFMLDGNIIATFSFSNTDDDHRQITRTASTIPNVKAFWEAYDFGTMHRYYPGVILPTEASIALSLLNSGDHAITMRTVFTSPVGGLLGPEGIVTIVRLSFNGTDWTAEETLLDDSWSFGLGDSGVTSDPLPFTVP